MEHLSTAWQSLPSRIDPVLFSLGPVELRWYGFMYVVAFATVYALVMRRLARGEREFRADDVKEFFTVAVLGVVLGGRLGYVLFYDLGYYAERPLEIVWPFDADGRFTGIAGMSYHGGLAGVIAAAALFCRSRGWSFLRFADFLAPAVPLGYTFGRLGNFLNGELYGRETAAPWGMIFPRDPSGLVRHPSQLYEAFLEGIVLFALLWPLRNRGGAGFVSGLYLAGYAAARFACEFAREPDPQLGTVLGPLTMGQLLCAAMAAAGALLIARSTRAGGATRPPAPKR